MGTQFWIVQAFNGVSYGALLFLVGAGLSLIFGVMRIVNLSHGSYFLLGGYVALSVIGTTGSWLLSIPIAALTIAVVGLIMERLFLRPEGRAKLVRDAVIALGIALVIRLLIGPVLPRLLPGHIGVYAALSAGTAFLLSGHRSVYASQKLGFTKSAGLEVPLDVPMGEVSRTAVRIRKGTFTEIVHRTVSRRRGTRDE